MPRATVSRRQFVRLAAAASATPRVFLRAGQGSANERLNVAFVGAGGRGPALIQPLAEKVNFAGFAEVDEDYAATTFKAHPKVPRYRDYRRMYDELERKIDAVVVATPDHHHYPASMMALKRGKHVYCEKPLAYTIEQCRLLAKVAQEKKLATQMGNQGNSTDSTRLIREWIKAGVLGEIREIRHWNDYPMAARESRRAAAIPAGLDWEMWLGPLASRPFTTGTIRMGWHPFSDVCNGLIGNWGTHHISAAWWALDLGAPSTIEVVEQTEWPVRDSYPLGFVLKYTFPARAARPEVVMYFHGGTKVGEMPRPRHLEATRRLTEAMGGPKGQVIVGSEASILAGPWCDGARIIPEKKMQEVGKVPWTVEGFGDHLESWRKACKEGTPTASNFQFAAAVTEIALLGSIALRHGKKLHWDSKNMRFLNAPEAERYLRVELRKGWDS
jgi:predicted dehydrogenase